MGILGKAVGSALGGGGKGPLKAGGVGSALAGVTQRTQTTTAPTTSPIRTLGTKLLSKRSPVGSGRTMTGRR